MTDYIKIGEIVAPHGLDGKVKIISDTNLKNKIFKVGSYLYLGSSKKQVKINSYQVSGKYDLLSFEDFLNIDLINEFLKQDIYVNLKELSLNNDEYLEAELIGAVVLEKKEELGQVVEILIGKKYNYAKVKGLNDFLLPLIKEYVISFNRDKCEIITQNAHDLII